MATQNPIEQEGTYPLPEAQLDRFLFKLDGLLPVAGGLTEILDRTTGGGGARRARSDSAADHRMQRLVREVPIAPHVTDFAARLVVARTPTTRAPPRCSSSCDTADPARRPGPGPGAQDATRCSTAGST